MRRYIVTPIKPDDGPKWEGGTPKEQGYKILPLPKLKRTAARNNEYYVYDNAEHKAVDADTAMAAAVESGVESPQKIVHMHVRMDNVFLAKDLEYISMDNEYLSAEQIMDDNPSASSEADSKQEQDTATPAEAENSQDVKAEEPATTPPIKSNTDSSKDSEQPAAEEDNAAGKEGGDVE